MREKWCRQANLKSTVECRNEDRESTRALGTYGPKKIQDELADQGILAGLNRIKRLRKQHGIRCTHKKKFTVTTDSKHHLPVAPHLLDRQFARTTALSQVWVRRHHLHPHPRGLAVSGGA